MLYGFANRMLSDRAFRAADDSVHDRTALPCSNSRILHLAIALDRCPIMWLHAGTRGGMTPWDAAAGSAVADAINAPMCSNCPSFDRARAAASWMFMTEGALP